MTDIEEKEELEKLKNGFNFIRAVASLSPEALDVVDFDKMIEKVLETQKTEGSIDFIREVAKLSPEALAGVDFDKTLKEGLEGMGFPQTAIRKNVDVFRKTQRVQKEAQMRQQQEAMLENMDKLNRSVEKGSMLDAINQMQNEGG